MSQQTDPLDLTVSPLTFLQIYQSTDTVMADLLAEDVMLQKWLLPPPLRSLGRYVILPLYYHLTTSGYGVTVNEQLIGLLYLRGWEQTLYIETIKTGPDWRQRGVIATLLRFSEEQARTLNREWIALTATLADSETVALYEEQGFRRGHWHIMRHPGNLHANEKDVKRVALRGVFGPPAETAYRTYTEGDLKAGDIEAALVLTQLMGLELYRGLGKEWAIEIDGQAAAYLNLHQLSDTIVVYLAALPEWWGRSELLDAVMIEAQQIAHSAPIILRFASSGHHEAARAICGKLGFEEQPAPTACMFKQIFG